MARVRRLTLVQAAALILVGVLFPPTATATYITASPYLLSGAAASKRSQTLVQPRRSSGVIGCHPRSLRRVDCQVYASGRHLVEVTADREWIYEDELCRWTVVNVIRRHRLRQLNKPAHCRHWTTDSPFQPTP